MKAIETHYQGYRFRSRLEARWAVFFDHMGIGWRYEPEGFDLDGDWYLPDFFLPRFPAWVEIKPELEPTDAEGALILRRCVTLARESKALAMVVSGQPWPGEHRVWAAVPCSCEKCADPVEEIGYFGMTADEALVIVELQIRGLDRHAVCPPMGYGCPVANHGRIIDAFEAARAARFEHGEAPS